MRSPVKRHAASTRAMSAAVLVLAASMIVAWSVVQEYRRAYESRTAAWTTNQWWWQQCNNMEFYEKIKEHMNICNSLEVILATSIKWHAGIDAWHALITRPLVMGAVAVAVLALVIFTLPLPRGEERRWRRSNLDRGANGLRPYI